MVMGTRHFAAVLGIVILVLSAEACATENKDLGTDSNGCLLGYETDLCAPDFTMPEASGEPVNLYEQRGNIVLVASEAIW